MPTRDKTIVPGLPPHLQDQLRENILGSGIFFVTPWIASGVETIMLSGTNRDGRAGVAIYRTDQGLFDGIADTLHLGHAETITAREGIPLYPGSGSGPMTFPVQQNVYIFGAISEGQASGVVVEF